MKEFDFSKNKDVIAAFCKKYHIDTLALFGSILTPNFHASSDVDVLVKFKKNHTPNIFELIDMETELSAIIGRQVDLKTANDLSPYFREEVLIAAKLIYDSKSE